MNNKRVLKIIFGFLKGTAATAAIILISFLLLEQSFRLYCFGFKSFSITMMNSIHGIGVSGLVQASPYPEIIYELKPDLNAYSQLKKLTTNHQGLRDKEYAITKPENTFRVAVIGDSVTMPAGVAIEDAFHSLLEDRYNHESHGTRYEFINFGVAGYDPRQYLATLKHRALAYEPDLVLVCLCGYLDNDFHPERHFHQPYVPLPEEHSFFKSLVMEFLKDRWAKKNNTGGGGVLDDRTKADKMDPITAALGDISREKNIPICIVVLRRYPYPNNGTDMDIRRLTRRDGL